MGVGGGEVLFLSCGCGNLARHILAAFFLYFIFFPAIQLVNLSLSKFDVH